MKRITEVDDEEEYQNLVSKSSCSIEKIKRSDEDGEEDEDEEGLNTEENQVSEQFHNVARVGSQNMIRKREDESPNVRAESEDKPHFYNENKVVSVSRVTLSDLFLEIIIERII